MELARIDGKKALKAIISRSSDKWKHYGFAMLPTQLLMDERVLKSSLLVFWVLTVHTFKGKTYCFPKIETIAKEAHCSKPTAIKGIRALETLGYLDVDRTKGRKNNKYYLKINNI